MKLHALIASLVLGSSAVALASPSASVSASVPASVSASASVNGSYGTTMVCDKRLGGKCMPIVTPPPAAQPVRWHGPYAKPVVYRPVTLASDLHFARDGRTFITVGDEMGRFQALKLTAGNGRTFIKQVYIQFENGQEQVLRNLDRTLLAHQSLTLDLDGNRRAIRRIVVYGNDLPAGRTYWRRAPSSFTVTGL